MVHEPGSDSATVSEDLADDCGLYSPMLSPRQQRGVGGSGESSSAEDLSIELTSPTARSSEFFAPPAEMRAPALSPGVQNSDATFQVCIRLVRNASFAGPLPVHGWWLVSKSASCL